MPSPLRETESPAHSKSLEEKEDKWCPYPWLKQWPINLKPTAIFLLAPELYSYSDLSGIIIWLAGDGKPRRKTFTIKIAWCIVVESGFHWNAVYSHQNEATIVILIILILLCITCVFIHVHIKLWTWIMKSFDVRDNLSVHCAHEAEIGTDQCWLRQTEKQYFTLSWPGVRPMVAAFTGSPA